MANDDLTAQERAEEQEISAAIKDTEGEIFDFANDREEPENDGDKSLEEMEDPTGGKPDEPEQEASADGEEAEADEPEADEAEDEGEAEPEQRGQEEFRPVPYQRLREVNEARYKAEREAAEWRARYDEMQRSVRPQQPAAPPPPEPDMFADPEGWKQAFQQRIMNETRQNLQQANLAETRARYGAEFQYAYDLIDKNPQFAQEAQAVLASPTPGDAIMRIAEPYLAEFREQRQQQELAEQQDWAARNGYRLVPERAGGPSNSRPQQSQLRNNPPSLNGASGGGNTRRERLDPRGMDGSEDAIFREAFTNLR